MSINELLQELDKMPIEESEMFIEIANKRLIEKKRKEIFNSFNEAIEDYNNGKILPETFENLVDRLKD